MDLFGLWLSVPVFYVIGLITVIRWIAHGGADDSKYTRQKIAAQLRQRAEVAPPEVRRSLLEAAAEVLGPAGYQPSPTTLSYPAHTPSMSSLAAPQPAQKAWLNQDLTAPWQRLDNINLILFLGAFLVVVSAGIFIGYNFETLSGGFKTAFLATFAGLFYLAGLAIFKTSIKLRPAGTTFAGIGLVLIPLVGLAAYNFTDAHNTPGVTWFITSVVTLAFYGVTLAITRQTFIAYLMAFTTLSLFESSLNLLGAPIYWYGWVMTLTSIALMSVGRWRGWWTEAAQSLTISAQVFVPISILLSLTQVYSHGAAQLSLTCVLATIFYGFMTWHNRHALVGRIYFGLGLSVLPLALVAGLWGNYPRSAIAVAVLGLTAVYVIGSGLVHQLTRPWQLVLAGVSGLMPFVGLLLAYDDPRLVLAGLLMAVVVNGLCAVQLRQTGLAFLASLATLAIPYVFLRQTLSPPGSWTMVSIGYLLITPVLVVWRQRIRTWPDSPSVVGIGGYFTACGLAIVSAFLADQAIFTAVVLAAAAMVYVIGIAERLSAYGYVAAGLAYLGLFQIESLYSLAPGTSTLMVAAAGVGLYALAYLDSHPARRQVLRLSGIIGPLLAAAWGVTDLSGGPAGPGALAIAGGLMLLEARVRRLSVLAEWGGAFMILAADWFFIRQGLTNAQYYSLPWSAYLAYLAYRRRHQARATYEGVVGVALGLLTLPVAVQAVASDGQIYGLELIFLAIGLVFAGVALRYKLVSWWGAGTLIAEVLYQLRSFLLGVPKYFISALLGLALLAVAVILLSRRKNQP